MADADVRHLQEVKERILSEGTFVRAVLSGRQRGQSVPWVRVVIRPVEVKGRRHWQVSHFDERRDVTQNYDAAAVQQKLDELLALPFKSLHVESTTGQLQVQYSRKGKVSIHRQKARAAQAAPSLAHDRQKDLLLPVGEPDSFLQSIGIMNREGKIRPRMRRKYRQINEFLRLVVETGVVTALRAEGGAGEQRLLRIVDCGCGNAYLSFAVYHYLAHVLRIPTQLTGIDVNRALIERRAELAERLGWSDLVFKMARIAEYEPDTPPDLVLALHACDTATDEALAQGVRWQARTILSVPCCHHHLQAQLGRQPPVMAPVYRYGILKERLGDVLTDALRAHLLRLSGYRAEVIQFVSPEHTDKNLMIRAVRSGGSGSEELRREYGELKRLFRVTPYLESLLPSETWAEQDL
jgi:SAM-dependent methyltransferase